MYSTSFNNECVANDSYFAANFFIFFKRVVHYFVCKFDHNMRALSILLVIRVASTTSWLGFSSHKTSLINIPHSKDKRMINAKLI